MLDRIDIHVEAPALRIEELRQTSPGESSETIRTHCAEARKRQQNRFADDSDVSGRCNARMGHSQIRKYCPISKEQGDLLQQAMEQLSLSARAYDRILKVTRTIADLAGTESIEDKHLLEAIQYRSLDRNLFY